MYIFCDSDLCGTVRFKYHLHVHLYSLYSRDIGTINERIAQHSSSNTISI